MLTKEQENVFAHQIDEIRGNLRKYSHGLKEMENTLRLIEEVLNPPLECVECNKSITIHDVAYDGKCADCRKKS